MGFFTRFTCENTPRNNFSSQNFSVENNYFPGFFIQNKKEFLKNFLFVTKNRKYVFKAQNFSSQCIKYIHIQICFWVIFFSSINTYTFLHHISHKKDLTFFIVKIFQEWKNLQVNFANKNFSVLIISFKKFEPFPSKILTLNTNFKEWSFTNFKLTRNLDHSVNNYLLQLHARATV